MLRRIVLALLLTGVAGIAAAAEAPPVVVELFTSQGCSSCPPADAHLGDLAKRPDVLALSYHVDYWNYIGWDDPFASREATQRQRDYARRLNQRFVYTPEMVVNGAAQDAGADRAAIARLIAEARAAPGPRPNLSLDGRADGGLTVRIGAATAGDQATVWLVRFDREHVTRVARGENGGRTLNNYHVVRELRPIGSWTGDAVDIDVAAEELTLPPGSGCAVLVQTAGTGPILAAALLK